MRVAGMPRRRRWRRDLGMPRRPAAQVDRRVVAAWRHYLRICREAADYEAVEPYAWVQLQARLERVDGVKK